MDFSLKFHVSSFTRSDSSRHPAIFNVSFISLPTSDTVIRRRRFVSFLFWKVNRMGPIRTITCNEAMAPTEGRPQKAVNESSYCPNWGRIWSVTARHKKSRPEGDQCRPHTDHRANGDCSDVTGFSSLCLPVAQWNLLNFRSITISYSSQKKCSSFKRNSAIPTEVLNVFMYSVCS